MAAGMILLAAAPAFAHGVGYRQSRLPPVSLEFFFSSGETMSFSEARVYSPQDDRFAFKSGRTDEAGRFAFTPDHPGRWRVVVRDDEGHRAEAVVDIAEDFGEEGENLSVPIPAIRASNMPEGAELFVRASLGVSLLFNIAAVVSLKRRDVKQRGEEK
jgi:nickel transport protein